MVNNNIIAYSLLSINNDNNNIYLHSLEKKNKISFDFLLDKHKK